MESSDDICKYCMKKGSLCPNKEVKVLPLLWFGDEQDLIEDNNINVEVEVDECPFYLEQLMENDSKEDNK